MRFQNEGGVKFDEYVVYHPQQALPHYVITYRSVTAFDASKKLLRNVGANYNEREILPSRNFKGSEDDILYRVAEAQFLRLIGGGAHKVRIRVG